MIGQLVKQTNEASEKFLELLESQAVDRITYLRSIGLDISVTSTGSFDLTVYVDEGQVALEFVAKKVLEWKEPLAALKALFTLIDLAGDTLSLTEDAIAGVNNITGSSTIDMTSVQEITQPIRTTREQLANIKATLPEPEELDQFHDNLLRLAAGLEKLKQLA